MVVFSSRLYLPTWKPQNVLVFFCSRGSVVDWSVFVLTTWVVSPASTRRWPNAVLMLAHRLRRGSTLTQHWRNVSCLPGWVSHAADTSKVDPEPHTQLICRGAHCIVADISVTCELISFMLVWRPRHVHDGKCRTQSYWWNNLTETIFFDKLNL